MQYSSHILAKSLGHTYYLRLFVANPPNDHSWEVECLTRKAKKTVLSFHKRRGYRATHNNVGPVYSNN